eukprot:m.71935 g.71935  ORF g.71935 m.71935 type:complete len:1314 (-) comp12320_c0_seq2:482-4423(-)
MAMVAPEQLVQPEDPDYDLATEITPKLRGTFTVDEVTVRQPWFLGCTSFEEAQDEIKGNPIGAFVIRQDANDRQQFTLHTSTRTGPISLNLQYRHGSGYVLEQEDQVFKHISHLVYEYSGHETLSSTLNFPLRLTDEQRSELRSQIHERDTAPFANTATPTSAVDSQGRDSPFYDQPITPFDNMRLQDQAAAGDPWTVTDVLSWAQAAGWKKYLPQLHEAQVDGDALLALDTPACNAMGLDQADISRFLASIDTIRQSITFERVTQGGSRIDVDIRDVDGEIVIVDPKTGREVHSITEAISKYLEQHGLKRLGDATPTPQTAANTSAKETTFVWEGDGRGWVRTLPGGLQKDEGDWDNDDLCDWLQHVNLSECIEPVRSMALDGAQLKAMEPDEQYRLGTAYGIGGLLASACNLFNVRVINPDYHIQRTSAHHETEVKTTDRNASVTSTSSVLPFGVDEYAAEADWFLSHFSSSEEATQSLADEDRNRAFFVCCTNDGSLTLEVVAEVNEHEEAGVKVIRTYAILREGERIKIEGSRLSFRNLSELVHVYANESVEEPYLICFFFDPQDYRQRPWFEGDVTVTQAREALNGHEPGTFVVFDVDDDQQGLCFVNSMGTVSFRKIMHDGEFCSLNDSSQRFETVTDLINFFTFVGDNELGVELVQSRSWDIAAHLHEGAAWFKPHITRQEAEQMLTGRPDGEFVVRQNTHLNGVYTLSYAYHGDPTGVRHMLIDQGSDNVIYFRGSSMGFQSLMGLVEFYATDPGDDLDCVLLLPFTQALSAPKTETEMFTTSSATTTTAMHHQDTFSRAGRPSDVELLSMPHPLETEAPSAELMSYPWYCVGMPREDALNRVQDFDGSFVIRSSRTLPDYLVLSYWCAGQIINEPIKPPTASDMSYNLLTDTNNQFESLVDLVAFYTATQSVLRCRLMTHRPHRVFPVEEAPWFFPNFSQDQTVSLLSGQPNGAFLIRNSQRANSKLVLCFVSGNNICQEYIDVSPEGYALDLNPNLFFPTLHDLVAHYSDNVDTGLSCRLVVFENLFRTHQDVFMQQAAQQSQANQSWRWQSASLPPQEQRHITLTRRSQHSLADRVRMIEPQVIDGQSERGFLHQFQGSLRLHQGQNTLRSVGVGREATTCQHCNGQQSQSWPQSHLQSQGAGAAASFSSRASGGSGGRYSSARSGWSKSSSWRNGSAETGTQSATTSRAMEAKIRHYGIESKSGQCWQLTKSFKELKRSGVLKQGGDFAVHKSEDAPKFDYALTVLTDRKRLNTFNIAEEKDEFFLEDFPTHRFDSMVDLLLHYCHPSQVDLEHDLGYMVV